MPGKVEPEFQSASARLPRLSQGMGAFFFSSQLCAKPQYPPQETNLAGKTVVLTGANAGLGFENASQLIDLKVGRLILAVRSQSKGDATVKALSQRHPSSKAKLEVAVLEMGSYDSIEAFVKHCQTLDRLDAVILNAGLMSIQWQQSASTGHEMMVQVNFLSTIYLAALLLPVLKEKSPRGTPGRLTVVNSGTAMHAQFPQRHEEHILTALDDKTDFDGSVRYALSKLLFHYFIDKLVQHVSEDDVVVNMVDPGLTKDTDLNRDIGSSMAARIFRGIKTLTGRRREDAASTYTDAVFVKGKESHGSFVMNWEILPYGQLYYDSDRPKVQQKLWDEVMGEFKFANLEETIMSMRK